jgi:lysophospholipase L1-like esterase
MRIILGWILVFKWGVLFAQDTTLPYYKEIRAFRQQDSLQFPAANQILFIGSSTFTRWTDVQQYFPGYKILNRAFGGSSLLDVIRYRYEVIYAYQPKQIVMYCGENDFANSDTVTVPEVVQRFKNLFRLIRARYPDVPFVYVSIKPSPSRRKLFSKYIEANRQIRQYLLAHKQTKFVDVYNAMLQADGQPNAAIFSEDSLHMNSEGYRIWQKKLQPVLIK